jgi:hypothetical protein
MRIKPEKFPVLFGVCSKAGVVIFFRGSWLPARAEQTVLWR